MGMVLANCLNDHDKPIIMNGHIDPSNLRAAPRVSPPIPMTPGISMLATCDRCGAEQRVPRRLSGQKDVQQWLKDEGWIVMGRECLCPRCYRAEREL